MESVLNPSEKDNLVSSFLEIAAGQTVDTAMQFLQATNWRLEEALQLFYVGDDGGGARPSTASSSVGFSSGVGDSVVADETVGGQIGWVDDVRPPLPVKREVLYNDASFYGDHRFHSDSVAFRNFEEETGRPDVSEADQGRPDVWESDQSAASSANSSQDNLASLYHPPFALMYQGTFDKAKVEASLQGKWLVVNVQSSDEFSSHMLNRDTWSNEAVAQTIRTNFIFWQAYCDTNEGKKVCNFYKLVNIPAILIIDPITGQKMHAWNGMVHPDRLLEDLLPFMDRGPHEHLVVLPGKLLRDTDQSSKQISTDKTLEQDSGEVLQAATAPVEDIKDVAGPSASAGEEAKSEEEVAVARSDAQPAYPPLPEEPKGSREILCRVGIRLPDGRRIQRNFLRTDPIQLLWSFCSSHLVAGERRPFQFTLVIPGASRIIEYGSELTFEESGLSNSMITLTWE